MIRKRHMAAALVTPAVLYVSSFLLFRAFPHEFSLAPTSSPQHYVVTFTDDAEIHRALRVLYLPLIETIPGHRYYPTRADLELLNRIPKLALPVDAPQK